jgi:ketosteroid isomerase-like protein
MVAAGLVFALAVGCAGLLKRGPSDEESVTQVMRQWVEGWKNLDADFMEPLLSETYYGANGEGKTDLLAYVRQWKTKPENQVTFSLDEVLVQVEGARASARGVRADVNVKESDIIGQYKLDYFLQKEDGVWRIAGAELAS